MTLNWYYNIIPIKINKRAGHHFMKVKVFQKGFNYSQDGTGNRLVFHLQGCNMRCPWCANPEGIAMDGTFIVNNDLLVDSVCPYGAVIQKKVDRERCKTCTSRECVTIHRNRGIRFSCEEYHVDTIIEDAKRCSPMFYDGGGITFSGGEPTLQFDVLSMLLKELKALGIHTAIETNATHPRLISLFPFIDMLIMDFKHYDNETCAGTTGVGNAIIKDNIIKALSYHKKVLIRTPVIKGFNDSHDDIINHVNFFKSQKTGNVSFEFLPYHEYGKVKWQQCSMPYLMTDGFVEDKTISLYKKIFTDNNLLVVNT